MATQRYISTSFWDDEWVQTLDPSEKLLYLYYMTNPLTNIAGVYKITVRRISFDTGFNLDTIGHIMQKFEKARKAYRRGEYIILPNWPKHQKWQESDKIKTGIDTILRSLPKDIDAELHKIGYAYPTYTLCVPNAYGSNYLDSDIDIDIDINSDIKSVHPSEDGTAAPITKLRKKFVKPSLQEVSEFCTERKNTVSPEKFLDYYEANGWRVGRNPMKDWRAAVRTWEKNEAAFAPKAARDFEKEDAERRKRTLEKVMKEINGNGR